MPVSKLAPVLLCLLAAVAVAGCSDRTTSSPTEPDGSPRVFAGTVGYQGESAHDLELVDDAVLGVTLAEIRVLLFDTTQASLDNLVFGLGIGQRDAAGECELTTNILIAEGELKLYRLSKDLYCITIFDAGSFPEDALISYRLKVEITS